MKEDLVSIITPVYNGEEFLDRSIQSVQAQTYENWELLLIDDGSDDNSVNVIEKYLSDDRIKIIKNDFNLGISATRNKGIQNSSGKYIALLDQDDKWFADKLHKQVSEFKKLDDSYGLIYSNLEVRFDSGKHAKQKIHIEPESDRQKNLELMLLKNLISSPTVLIRKEVIQDVGKFDTSILWGGDDYDLWIRIAHKYKFKYLDEVLCTRYEHQKNYSANKKKMMFRTIALVEKYVDEFGLNPDIKKRVKSNHYYRFGVESLKKNKILTGLSYILKSLVISGQGFKELSKTIKKRTP